MKHILKLKIALLAVVFLLVGGVVSGNEEVERILTENCVRCHHTVDQLMNEEKYRDSLIDALVSGRMPEDGARFDRSLIPKIKNWINENDLDQPIFEAVAPQRKLELIENHLNSISEKTGTVYFIMVRYDRRLFNSLSILINSVSWSKDIVFLQEVGESKQTIFYINLSEIKGPEFDEAPAKRQGWDFGHFERWNAITKSSRSGDYPYDSDYGEYNIYQNIKEMTGIEIPIVFADWFIANVSSGERLYHDALYDDHVWENDHTINNEDKLIFSLSRQTSDKTEDMRQSIDPSYKPYKPLYQAGGVYGSEDLRTGYRSKVAKYNRILDRMTSQYGVYWKSYDFDSNDRQSNIFNSIDNFIHFGNEMIFNLPNGFHAYFITDRSGKRIESAPEDIVYDNKNNSKVINGVSCMSCHIGGIRKFTDELKDKNPTEASQSSLDSFVDEDNERYEAAFEKFGLTRWDNSIPEIHFEYINSFITKEDAAEIFGLEISEYEYRIKIIYRDNDYYINNLLSESGISRNDWEYYFPQIEGELYKDQLASPSIIVSTDPKETTLLANYPNPSNPETWIPYSLSEDADVTISIYNVTGHLVRTLSLGYQTADEYYSRSSAAHWDGRNEFGERVASGMYFYNLTAGDFSATRKLMIRK